MLEGADMQQNDPLIAKLTN